jgi:hypothetical protein
MKRIGLAGLMVYTLLLFAVQGASAHDGRSGCPWGAAYDPMAHVLACLSGATAPESSAPKTAGLAAPAPTREQFVPCSVGEGLDPLLDPQALACLTQSVVPAAKAASKPAGLAAPAPAVDPKQSLPCLPWGDVYDPATMMLSYGPECVSRPAANSAAPKTAGLAKLTPVEEFVPCGSSESLDPLLNPLALACLSQPVAAAKAASKPAGLAAPAQEISSPLCDAGESPNRCP